jgi:hypothetical protein
MRSSCETRYCASQAPTRYNPLLTRGQAYTDQIRRCVLLKRNFSVPAHFCIIARRSLINFARLQAAPRVSDNRSLPKGDKRWERATRGEAVGEIAFTMAARQGVKARTASQRL